MPMIRLTTALSVAVLMAATAVLGAAEKPKPVVLATDQYMDLKIPTPSLQKALTKVPAETALVVYLPPSYGSTNKRYPVVNFLHGAEESAKQWSKPVSQALQAMYNGGFGTEFIIAFATGNNILGSTFLTNSPVAGNWEDHIVNGRLTRTSPTS